MKTIKMKETVVEKNSDGVNEVFGIGKTYTLDDKIADTLMKGKSAVEVKEETAKADD